MRSVLCQLKKILADFDRRRRERAESRERLLFTSQLVHDVKNLLSVIHGSGLLIQQETVCTPARTYVEHIIERSEFLNRLLEDILSLNQAELGNLPVKRNRGRAHRRVGICPAAALEPLPNEANRFRRPI